MGRKRINAEQTMARFPPGTLARIKWVLKPRETQAEFILEAIDRELLRRRPSKRGGKRDEARETSIVSHVDTHAPLRGVRG